MSHAAIPESTTVRFAGPRSVRPKSTRRGLDKLPETSTINEDTAISVSDEARTEQQNLPEGVVLPRRRRMGINPFTLFQRLPCGRRTD